MTPQWSPLFIEAVQHHRAGNTTRAEQLYRRVIAEEHQHAAAHSNLGVIMADRGNLVQAEKFYRAALEIDPQFAEVYFNLGNLLAKLNRIDEAIAAYDAALAAPNPPIQARFKLWALLFEQGRNDEAVRRMTDYTRAFPQDPEGWHLLGMAHLRLGRKDEALAALRQSVELLPNHALGRNSLGLALEASGDLAGAVAQFEIATRLQPPSAEAFNNLAMARVTEGRAPEAIPLFRQSLALSPKQSQVFSNYLLALNYVPNLPTGLVLAEHKRWAAEFADRLPAVGPLHRCHPDGVLHVGYVSADFRGHPVGAYLSAVLPAHDRGQVRVSCFATLLNPDATTERLRAAADAWHDITRLSDADAAELIRSQRVDVLVDLSGHTARNRLRVFARRPAPVLVTHFGYPNTTGLAAMQFRLTDATADPPGAEPFYVERLIGLPDLAWCWRPPDEAPAVGPLPAGASGSITFGSLNNVAKLSDPALELWARILDAVPESRLLVLGNQSRAGEARILAQMARRGLDGRVEVLPRMPPAEYYAAYNRIDLALDPFPYNGGVTTCDAVWMGVPVVALTGTTYAGRQGASILRTIGLFELSARSADEYLAIAVDWARERDRLQATRAGLRDRIRASPLVDATRFTRHLEAAYRSMVKAVSEKR